MLAILLSGLLMSGQVRASDLPDDLRVSLAYVDPLSTEGGSVADAWSWQRTRRDSAGRIVEYTEGHTVSLPDAVTGELVPEDWPVLRKIYMWSPDGRLVAYSHEAVADETVAYGCLAQVETVMYTHDAAGDVISEISIAQDEQRTCTFDAPWRGADQSDPVQPLRRRPKLGVRCQAEPGSGS